VSNLSAVDEVARRIEQNFVEKMRRQGASEEYILKFKDYEVSTFKTITIHRRGFIDLLRQLSGGRMYTKQTLVDMARRGVIVEDPLLIDDYLNRYKDILFQEKYGAYTLTPLGERLLTELRKKLRKGF
jgi:hypothetical protein